MEFEGPGITKSRLPAVRPCFPLRDRGQRAPGKAAGMGLVLPECGRLFAGLRYWDGGKKVWV